MAVIHLPRSLRLQSRAIALLVATLSLAFLLAVVTTAPSAKGKTSGKPGQIALKHRIKGDVPAGARPPISITVTRVGKARPSIKKRLRIRGNRTTRVKALPLGKYRITGRSFRIADALFSPRRPVNLTLTKRKPSKRVTFVFERQGGGQVGGAGIRFNLAGAIGLMRTEEAGRGSKAASRNTTGSNLLALLPSGEVRAAIEVGKQTNPLEIESFSVSPDGSVYVHFKDPLYDLVPSSTNPSANVSMCNFVKVNPASGSAVCVDSEAIVVQLMASVFGFRFEAVEFDRSGSVYYVAFVRQSDGVSRPVVRKKGPDGVITDLSPVSDPALNDFEVSADGSVLMSGSALRVVTPQGLLKDLTFPGSIPFGWMTAGGIRRFPDGRVFINGIGPSEGVFSYNDLEARMDPTPWIGPASVSPQHSLESFCSALGGSAVSDFPRYCANDPSVRLDREKVVLADSRVFDAQSDGGIAQVYPQFKGIRTRLDRVTAAEDVGNRIILGGSESGSFVTLAIDPDTGAESVLIPPQEAIEIYNLQYSPSSDKLFFDGRRASDNSYVFGSVRPSGGNLSVEQASTGRWKEFEVFG